MLVPFIYTNIRFSPTDIQTALASYRTSEFKLHRVEVPEDERCGFLTLRNIRKMAVIQNIATGGVNCAIFDKTSVFEYLNRVQPREGCDYKSILFVLKKKKAREEDTEFPLQFIFAHWREKETEVSLAPRRAGTPQTGWHIFFAEDPSKLGALPLGTHVVTPKVSLV